MIKNDGYHLESIEDFFHMVEELNSKSEEDLQNILERITVVHGEFFNKFRMKVRGKNYHGTLSGHNMQGIVEFQKNLNRAMAYILYGEANLTKLKQHEEINLIFEINEGCTELIAELNKLLDRVKNMSSQKIVIIGCFCLAGFGLWSWHNTKSESIAYEHKKEEDTRNKEHELNRMRLFGELLSKSNFKDTTEIQKLSQQGYKDIVRHMSDADSIEFIDENLDKEEIEEISSRAPTTKREEKLLTKKLLIDGILRKGEHLYVSLRSKDSSVIFSSSKIDEKDIFDLDKNRLIKAFEKNEEIELELKVTYKNDEVISSKIEHIIGITT